MKRNLSYYLLLLLLLISCNTEYEGVNPEITNTIKERLSKLSKDRAKEIDKAIRETPESEREGTAFLYAYMPQHDLDTISVALISKNVEYAYKARRANKWASDIPLELFYNDVLPYVSMDETREEWRELFYELFSPLVVESKNLFEAIDTINIRIRDLVKVEYNTKRRKANQSAFESMEIGMASCSGLSILFTNALRSVGIPSRLAGAPQWVTKEGNHSWNEVWADGKWYFAEYYPAKLNHSWFLAKCAAFENSNNPLHQVYATSFKPTNMGHFPMVWDMRDRSVAGLNVTDRYVALHKEQTQNKQSDDKDGVNISVKIYKKGGDSSSSGDRVAVNIKIYDINNNIIAEGLSSDANADMNNYFTAKLDKNSSYKLIYGDKEHIFKTTQDKDKQLILYY